MTKEQIAAQEARRAEMMKQKSAARGHLERRLRADSGRQVSVRPAADTECSWFRWVQPGAERLLKLANIYAICAC